MKMEIVIAGKLQLIKTKTIMKCLDPQHLRIKWHNFKKLSSSNCNSTKKRKQSWWARDSHSIPNKLALTLRVGRLLLNKWTWTEMITQNLIHSWDRKQMVSICNYKHQITIWLKELQSVEVCGSLKFPSNNQSKRLSKFKITLTISKKLRIILNSKSICTTLHTKAEWTRKNGKDNKIYWNKKWTLINKSSSSQGSKMLELMILLMCQNYKWIVMPNQPYRNLKLNLMRTTLSKNKWYQISNNQKWFRHHYRLSMQILLEQRRRKRKRRRRLSKRHQQMTHKHWPNNKRSRDR